ncbi:hypothetical protein O3M35_002982 [Rhynocoris fuscipes]|uniref:Vps16 C-terminal domain-containing protein n=1 Tax=Rhynocoris fuscipes TaxID=488301 RepID=A0AAW1CPZ7_9HEMI
MSGQSASEEFWNSSSQKGFNFGDDDDESTATQMCGISLEGTVKLSQQIKTGLGGQNNQKDFFDSFSQSSLIDDQSLQVDIHQLLSQKSLDAILNADNVDYNFFNHEMNTNEEELRMLRRQVESRWSPPDINSVLRQILTGKPYSLELYKSYKLKQELLRAAINLGDGDAILTITFFLSRTLKKSHFYKILSANPIAVQHYISYLAIRMQFQELTDILEMLGQNKDAAIIQFIVACQNPQRQLQRLKSCLRNYFNESKDKMILENFIKLLEWQETVDGGKLLRESVASSLAYVCKEHWGSTGSLSAQTLVQDHQVNDKVFKWIALNERARAAAWDDISALFVTKGWLGGRRLKCDLPLDHIVTLLHKYSAPPKVLISYLELIENLETRMDTAKRVQCHRAVIDAYLLQRDRLGLVSYKANLHPQSEDYFYAEQVLRLPNTKWKN